MYRFIVAAFVVFALVACGGSPATTGQGSQSSAVPTSAGAAPAPTQMQTTAEPTTVPATIAPTDVPTPTTAPTSADLATPVQKGYTALVLIKGSAVMLDDTAQQIQDGKIEGLDGFGRLVAIGAILKAVDEVLGKDAPDAALTAAWTQGRAVVPKLRGILSQWIDKKISSKDVPGLTAPIQPEIDQMFATADADLSSVYGVDQAKLKEMRDKVIADLQRTLQATPTPKS